MGETFAQVRIDPSTDVGNTARGRRRWLALAHTAWLVCAALALVIFLAAIPMGYALRFSGAGFGVPIEAPAWYIAAMSVAQGVASILAAIVSLALAAILFLKKRDEPMALFVSFYLLAHGIVSAGPLEALNQFPPLFPGAPTQSGMLISVEQILVIQTMLLAVTSLLLFYLFPNGRFIPGWTRYAALLALFLAPALTNISAYEWSSPMDPLAWSVVAAFMALLGAGVYAQLYRYRRVASPVERQQTKWVVFGFILNICVMLVLQVPYVTVAQIPAGIAHPWWEPLSGLGWWMAVSILPVSLAIAVMRFRLWDIDLIANRALVYSLLSGSVVAIYVLLVVVLGTLFQTSGSFLISLIATALVALLFQPMRERLQRGVNRLMYGERDDPYAVLSRLGQRLQATIASEAVLPTIVETVAQTLKLPYAGIELKQGDEFKTVATYGLATGEPLSLPLTYQSELIGQLVLSRRARGEDFTFADRHLLDNIARETGVAAHAVRVTADLQRSRERLVTAREEERRRIRRDLHDGLGPALASLTLKADAARNLLSSDPAAADALLAELKTQTQSAIADIRRLVYELGPPALDELGLVSALREQAAQYNVANGLHVSVIASESHWPALPAAVEVAAYRIALEALTNVARHAQASSCQVRIACDGALTLEIIDNGIGVLSMPHSGVGLQSMRERAAELGGACIIESVAGNGGTRVFARLPLLEK